MMWAVEVLLDDVELVLLVEVLVDEVEVDDVELDDVELDDVVVEVLLVLVLLEVLDVVLLLVLEVVDTVVVVAPLVEFERSHWGQPVRMSGVSLTTLGSCRICSIPSGIQSSFFKPKIGCG